jgi:hypothetical protein
MALTYKVLGQVDPVLATLTTLYTVPASTSTVVSTIVACNRGAATTIRIAVRPAGAAIDPKHYICYDVAIAANETITFTLGITLATTDVISVYATLATIAFSAFGSEIS